MINKPVDDGTLKKNRRRAVMFGVITGIAFIAIVYALVQKSEAEKQVLQAIQKAKLVDSLQMQLTGCNEAARAQQHDAQVAMDQARRAQQQAEEALKKAIKK